MEKKKEIELAKKRRRLLLRRFERSGLCKAKFALIEGISRQRLGQLLDAALIDLAHPS